MTTRTTDEQRLALAVPTIDETAFMTPLRSVPRIHRFHTATEGFGLVSEEACQLCERPGVQSTFGFASAGLDTGSDIREIFDNDGGSWQDVRQDAF